MGSSTVAGKKSRVKSLAGKARSDNPVRMTVSRTHKPEEVELEEWQRLLRKQYGEQQQFHLENRGNHPIFSEFILTNPQSQKTYKVAIRGDKPGDNYCSCPDFQINNLGTCKHIAFTLNRLTSTKRGKRIFAKG
ncbi:MAG: SWIM zinc finger domain-containing protein, partial [Syntrophales bacterium LBB04]|nr:SWIM zinc finger domain-containing protein [Syntrophales bacterium LBB04]